MKHEHSFRQHGIISFTEALARVLLLQERVSWCWSRGKYRYPHLFLNVVVILGDLLVCLTLHLSDV